MFTLLIFVSGLALGITATAAVWAAWWDQEKNKPM